MTNQQIIAKYAKCAVCRNDGLRSEMQWLSNTGRGQLKAHAECIWGTPRATEPVQFNRAHLAGAHPAA
jgi:hypothetical protein